MQSGSHWDAVVLGAGISGLVSAAILVDQGVDRILMIDEYPEIGGNHLDFSIGPYTFDVGSLIFQDDSPLLRWFPELMDGYLPISPSWSKLTPQGAVTGYPFSPREDLLSAGAPELAKILGSAAWARIRRRRQRSALDFARHWLGVRFTRRSGLENYMERFCGLPASEIDLAFAENRMRWISERARIGPVLESWRHRSRPKAPTNRQLARPRAGFQELYAPVRARLEATGVTMSLGTSLNEIAKNDQGFDVRTGSGAVTADRVVSTIPLEVAARACGLADGELPTVTLMTLFFSFEGDRGFEKSIFYNFSHVGRWKRVTVYSDFYGRVDGREYFNVEIIVGSATTSPDEEAEGFRAHLTENGLLRGDLRLEGHHVLTHAYPVYTRGSGERAAATIAALKDFGIESFGRQGGFQYQPTSRVSTLEAEAALEADAVEASLGTEALLGTESTLDASQVAVQDESSS